MPEEFKWDYSFFKWRDIPREVRREMVKDRSVCGRTWMHGRTKMVADVFKQDARQMYNENWDWLSRQGKEKYRRLKLFRNIDRIVAPDPAQIEYDRQRQKQ